VADKHIVVAAHGHCFDGLVSATMFTHFRDELDRRSLRFTYRSCGYGPNMQTVPHKWLNGDENAIVDFRFSDSKRLTWYFDHHITAFASDAQRKHALNNRRYYYDPELGSCTQLIVDVGRKKHGTDFSRFESLIQWADKIDSANFTSAKDAIDRSHPVMQLSAVVEQHGNGALLTSLTPRLLREPVEDVASSEDIQQRWRPIRDAMRDTRANRVGTRSEGRRRFCGPSRRTTARERQVRRLRPRAGPRLLGRPDPDAPALQGVDWLQPLVRQAATPRHRSDLSTARRRWSSRGGRLLHPSRPAC
jgi:hypothetical protein